MRKLIIDADTGSDDAVALVMAIRNLPKESILGITVAAGNVPLKQGISNALYVNELCDTNINVYAGESAPMYRPYIELDNMEQATAHALSEDPASSSAQSGASGYETPCVNWKGPVTFPVELSDIKLRVSTNGVRLSSSPL